MNQNDKRIYCNLCNERSKNQEWHNYHMDQSHCSVEKRTCICGKVFKTLKIALEHTKNCKDDLIIEKTLENKIKMIVERELNKKIKELRILIEQEKEKKTEKVIYFYLNTKKVFEFSGNFGRIAHFQKLSIKNKMG